MQYIIKRHLLKIVGVSFLLMFVLVFSATTGGQVGTANAENEAVWESVDAALQDMGVDPAEAVRLSRLTAYNPVARQTDADPEISSCGPSRPDQIALSRDLFFDASGHKHLCGSKVVVFIINPDTEEIEAVEERIVWDTMHQRYSSTGDIFMNTTDESVAYEFGVKEGVIVFVSS